MKIPFLDLQRQHKAMEAELQRIFQDVLLRDVLLGGKAISDFEAAFAMYIGQKYCVSCANGTDALEIILRALEIGEGDEVLVPANGWLSAAEVVRLLHARPVFVEVDPATYTMDPARLKALISERSRAIIPIHLYGQAADMPTIMEIAAANNLYVIEDCAQAHGAAVYGQRVGSFGHAAAFSFYPTKNLGALGDAGAILCPDPQLAEKCRLIASHGQVAKDRHIQLGFNSRMDTLQAAVLLHKLPLLDVRNEKRRKQAALYHQMLQDLPLTLPLEHEGFEHVYHLFVIRCQDRDALQAFLAENGVGTAIHYPHAVASMPFLQDQASHPAAGLSVRISKEILSLPLYPELKEDELVYVAQKVRQFYDSR
jgi:dTDP-4-amino-4,6-dideoxygalactose transaminase